MAGDGGKRGTDRSLRAGYLGFFGALGAFIPFAALYFRDLGMSGVQVCVLAALPAGAVAVCGPLFASVADAQGLHRPALRVAFALAVLLALAATQVSTFGALIVVSGLLAIALAPVAALLDGYALTLGGGGSVAPTAAFGSGARSVTRRRSWRPAA